MRSERRPNSDGRWIVGRVRRIRQAGAVDWRSESCRKRETTDRSAGGRGCCDEGTRIRGATRFATRKIDSHNPDLRSELRLRANQRGVHDLSWRQIGMAGFIKVAKVADLPE